MDSDTKGVKSYHDEMCPSFQIGEHVIYDDDGNPAVGIVADSWLEDGFRLYGVRHLDVRRFNRPAFNVKESDLMPVLDKGTPIRLVRDSYGLTGRPTSIMKFSKGFPASVVGYCHDTVTVVTSNGKRISFGIDSVEPVNRDNQT